MSRFMVCGGFDNGNGMCDLVCDTSTGEVILVSDLMGNCYLSEITVLDPVKPTSDNAVANILKYFNADGVILSTRHMITLEGNKAIYRNYADYSKIEAEIEFDTDMQCEERLDY